MLKSMVVLAGGIALASLCVAQASAADVFTISSKTFKDGTMLPKAASNKNAGNNPNCVGENVSPELSWVNPPPRGPASTTAPARPPTSNPTTIRLR
jgi:phosphatidylethanolamine-binding protein (PEBP) family uncharacterized protein